MITKTVDTLWRCELKSGRNLKLARETVETINYVGQFRQYGPQICGALVLSLRILCDPLRFNPLPDKFTAEGAEDRRDYAEKICVYLRLIVKAARLGSCRK
jgi:hypothetical protein